MQGDDHDHLLYRDYTINGDVIAASSSAVATKALETTTPTTAAISPLLDQKIDMITAGLPASYGKNLRLLSNQENISIIIEYIQALKTETSLSDHYRKDNIELLTRFSNFHNNKLFKDITRDDFIAFLDSFRKLEDVDPLHKWIGTYNQFRMYLGDSSNGFTTLA